jgi:hypothetical protein
VTVSRPNMTEKLDRLIDDMRLLRAQMIGLDRQMIGLDRQMKGIEAYLKRNEPSEQPSSKMRSSLAAAARAVARTVLVLFAVGAVTSAVLRYLVT